MIPASILSAHRLTTADLGKIVFIPGEVDPFLYCQGQYRDEWPIRLVPDGPLMITDDLPASNVAVLSDWRLEVDPSTALRLGSELPAGTAIIAEHVTGLAWTTGVPGQRGATRIVGVDGKLVEAHPGAVTVFSGWRIVTGPLEQPIEIFRRSPIAK
jgi:hypothetical protein